MPRRASGEAIEGPLQLKNVAIAFLDPGMVGCLRKFEILSWLQLTVNFGAPQSVFCSKTLPPCLRPGASGLFELMYVSPAG